MLTRTPCFSWLIAMAVLADLKRGESMPSLEFVRRYNDTAEDGGLPALRDGSVWQFTRTLEVHGLVERSEAGPRGTRQPYFLSPTSKGMDLLDNARRVLE